MIIKNKLINKRTWEVSSFRILAIILKFLYVFWSKYIENIPSSRIAKSQNVYVFHYSRHCQTVFQRGCTSLYPHQKCTKMLIVLYVVISDNVLKFSYPNGCVVLFPYGIDLHFYKYMMKLSTFSQAYDLFEYPLS